MAYLDYPLAETAEAVTRRILLGIAARIPGWTPGGEGTLEVALAEEIGREVADLKQLAVDVSAAVVRAMGQSLFGVAYLPGVAATLPVAVTFSRQRATLPAGFTVVGTTVDGVDVAFRLPQAVQVGATSTASVVLTAADVGDAFNGVPTGSLRIATATEAVIGADATAASAGGVDPETDEEYQDRLVSTLSTLTRTPILPADYAVRARDVVGVHRATAVDGYNPSDGTTNNARTITVFPITEDGLPVSAAVKTALVSLLDGLREVNFDVYAADPTYTAVNVTFTAVAEKGYTPADVRAAIIARGLQLLSPATWAGGDETPPEWTGDNKVRYLELARELGSVDGVAYLQDLTVNGGRADVTLPGVAPLPAAATAGTPTTVTGTVS